MLEVFAQYCEMPRAVGEVLSLSMDSDVRVAQVDSPRNLKASHPVETSLKRTIALLASSDIPTIQAYGSWENASDDPVDKLFCAIKKSADKALVAIYKSTFACVNPDKDCMALIVNDKDALKFAMSREVHTYLKCSHWARKMAIGDSPGRNAKFRLPDTLYGLELVITEHKKPGSALVVSRNGEASLGVEDYGKPSFTTVRLYHHGPREENGLDRCVPVISPLSAVRIEGIMDREPPKPFSVTLGSELKGEFAPMIRPVKDGELFMLAPTRIGQQPYIGIAGPERAKPAEKFKLTYKADAIDPSSISPPYTLPEGIFSVDGIVECQFGAGILEVRELSKTDPDLAAAKPECKCPDLLNGHHNGCPLKK